MYNDHMPRQELEWEGQDVTTQKRPNFFQRNATKEAVSTDAVARPTLKDRLDGLLPPHRKYLGRSRRTFLLGLLALLLCLLALVLGLGIGLGTKKKSSAALPLPSNTATFTGDITYYGTGLGACGITSKDTDYICAVSRILYDAASISGNPNENPLCGKKIRVRRTDAAGTTRSIDVTVVDRCEACAPNDLDLSPTGFDELADHALGRTTASWAWLSS